MANPVMVPTREGRQEVVFMTLDKVGKQRIADLTYDLHAQRGSHLHTELFVTTGGPTFENDRYRFFCLRSYRDDSPYPHESLQFDSLQGALNHFGRMRLYINYDTCYRCGEAIYSSGSDAPRKEWAWSLDGKEEPFTCEHVASWDVAEAYRLDTRRRVLANVEAMHGRPITMEDAGKMVYAGIRQLHRKRRRIDKRMRAAFRLGAGDKWFDWSIGDWDCNRPPRVQAIIDLSNRISEQQHEIARAAFHNRRA